MPRGSDPSCPCMCPPDSYRRIRSRRRRGLETLRAADSPLRPELRRMLRSEEHTSELQSLMRISYAVFCLKKKKQEQDTQHSELQTLQRHQHTVIQLIKQHHSQV